MRARLALPPLLSLLLLVLPPAAIADQAGVAEAPGTNQLVGQFAMAWAGHDLAFDTALVPYAPDIIGQAADAARHPDKEGPDPYPDPGNKDLLEILRVFVGADSSVYEAMQADIGAVKAAKGHDFAWLANVSSSTGFQPFSGCFRFTEPAPNPKDPSKPADYACYWAALFNFAGIALKPPITNVLPAGLQAVSPAAYPTQAHLGASSAAASPASPSASVSAAPVAPQVPRADPTVVGAPSMSAPVVRLSAASTTSDDMPDLGVRRTPAAPPGSMNGAGILAILLLVGVLFGGVLYLRRRRLESPP